jgi:hypothetical protein
MKNILLSLVFAAFAFSGFGQQQKWHELEGYFQSPSNKEMVVRFTARDSMLVAKAFWNNVEIHLLPDTGLSFVSKEAEDGNPIRIRFLRDASGAVNQINVANNDVWTRVTNYTPQTKTEMAHTPDQLRKFIGLYQLKEDTTNYVRIGVDSNTLTIHQQWDGEVVDNFAPESALSFFKKERPNFTLSFSTDQQGQVTQFVAFGRDTWIRTGQLKISPAGFKAFEGKYRSKDDPDNEVRLTATDTGLLVKQLWDSKEVAVRPYTHSYFYNEQRKYALHIVTDSQGKVIGILLLGRELFNKIDE